MTHKKLKITIEYEGQPTQILEARGIAAALLDDGDGEDNHKLSCLLVGRLNQQDLLNLHDGVETELAGAVAQAIIGDMAPIDLIKALLGGKHEPKR